MKQRVSALLVDQGKILLIRRTKPNEEYYTLPGGTVETGEGLDAAMRREIKEELSIVANIKKLPLEVKSSEREDYYFLVESVIGKIVLGGPEAERMSAINRYKFEWVELDNVMNLKNFYADSTDIKEKLISLLKSNE